MNSSALERPLMTPDSETIIMWTVANKLNAGQWQKLYRILMNKSEEIIVPAQIKGIVSCCRCHCPCTD